MGWQSSRVGISRPAALEGIDKDVLFNVELVYGGVFRVKNVPEAQMPILLMVEGPRLIFPFARQVLANVTRPSTVRPRCCWKVRTASSIRLS